MEVKNRYKQTEVGLIPNDWEVRTIGEISKLKNGYAFSSDFFSKTGPIVITPGNFKLEGGLKFNEKNTLRYSGSVTKEMQFENGDLLIVMTDLTPDCNLLGKPGIVNSEEVILHNQRIGKITITSNIIIQDYLYRFFLSELFSKRMKETATGSTVRHTSVGSISNSLIAIPTKAEQTAIATSLSDMDDLINSLSTLIEKKKAIKQGVMQELLKPNPDSNQEGWEMKKLVEVVEIRKGQLITDSTRVDGNVPVIAGGKSPAYYHDKANRNGKTITISGSGASAGYVAFHNYPIFASDCSTIEEHKDYSVEYIFYLLQHMQERIYKLQTGGAQPHIHPSDLYPLEVPIPKKETQEKIATILLDMDNEIQSLEQNLTKYQMLKQGMMQELLTGKTRLV